MTGESGVRRERVHFVGIGGAGLSAIAALLLESGYTVSGSDAALSPFARRLAERGASVYEGHAADNVKGADRVIVSSAIPPDNPEIAAARAQGIPVHKRADFLGALMEGRVGVAVAGTHGKTTTTGLIAYLLDRAGQDPTFIVGGDLIDYGLNARAGQGRPFVVEADEYDRMFLGLRPTLAVITNVEHDHVDCYPTPESVQEAFQAFGALVPGDGLLIVCADDGGAREVGALKAQGRLGARSRVATYGLRPDADWGAEAIQPNGAGGNDFLVTRSGETLGLARNRLPGIHNVVNSLAALAAADFAGVDFNTARNALAEFRGAGRRFEVKGEARGVTVVDDYAHHPTEIRSTLAAARRRFPGRPIWAMFQPHTFSRTRAFLAEFAASFRDADHVVITEIYRSREGFDPSVSGEDIVRRMQHADARYIPALAEAAEYLAHRLKAGDVLITLGAGDGHTVGEGVLEKWKNGN